MTLAVRGARRVFSQRRAAPVVALDGVDLVVDKAELVVVIGPSGSGKTTLLRAIAGLDPLESGRVEINGSDVCGQPPGRRNVAMVFQEYALLPHLSVFENIAFGERARGTPKPEVRRLVEEASGVLDVGALLDRRPPELSGGQRQRVALARAMVRRPAAFLLDEPLSSMDTELRLRARAETRALQRRLAVAMVYVTHDQHEAMALADRIVVLRDGRVEQVGTPAELFDCPANGFVARFLSPLPMNLVPVTLLGGDGDAVVGVRPERLRLVAPADGRFASRVLAVEPAGEDAVVHLAASGHRLLAKVSRDARPREGADVGVAWANADEHRFASRDGARLR
ncbi:MAG: ABC transporter ATP-binding protein [Nocardioidaceae bacterium]